MDLDDNIKKTKGFSLRPTLVTSVTCLILLAASLVGSFAYFQSKDIINQVWTQLAQLISQTITERTLGFLRPAIPFLKFSTGLAQYNIIDTGTADVDDPTGVPQDMMEYLYTAIHTDPDFSWASFSSLKGTYIAAYRQGDAIRITWRMVKDKTDSGDSTTFIRNYKRTEAGVFEKVEEYNGKYDPRTRPFWKIGLANPGGAWTPAYAFWTNQQPGIAYVQPQFREEKFIGLWVVEYELSHLSDYLANLEEAFTGPIGLMTDEGVILASSAGVPPIVSDSSIEAAKSPFFEQPQIKLLTNAWNYAKQHVQYEDLFSYKQYLAGIKTFPKESGIQWDVLTMMPKSQLFASVIAETWRAFYIALALCLLCIGVAALFFGHISKRLREIAYEMYMIKNFQFSSRIFSAKPSMVREINLMNNATDSMKIGLHSFSKYVPVQLVQDLIESGQTAILGGEKKELSILFCDLANFTSLAEQMPPKELLEILEQYLQGMSDCIIANKGTVDKYIGDSIMAFWGAPKFLEDHAIFACQAALAMKGALSLLWKQWEKEGKPLLRQRIGINTGTAIVGNIGSPSRMDYTAIGDHVNLASRLEGLNKMYGTQILIGESTADFVKECFLVRPVDWVAVKGKSQFGLIYELINYMTAVDEGLKIAVKTYTEGLDLYKNRKFEEAIGCFEKANQMFGGNDGPSQAMKSRCAQYIETPPPDEWKGYTILKDK